MNASDLIVQLKKMANPDNVAGMARFGISSTNTLGVSMPEVRKLARGLRDHQLALDLWVSGIHEARILAALVDDPHQVTLEQMEQWAADFDSWDVCDQVIMNLFDRTPFAVGKAHAWAAREEEFVKRAGFALMASLAVHDKKAPDQVFLDFLPLIVREAGDGRNFVKKAINWALRQIGKRNPDLQQAAIHTARSIQTGNDNAAARWVAADALRELESRVVKPRKN
jgi:3-methyladenine DNA glycosylase AlkD